MKVKFHIDNSIQVRGRAVAVLVDANGLEIDREIFLKHPFLFRIRGALAARRVRARHRKMGKLQARFDKLVFAE